MGLSCPSTGLPCTPPLEDRQGSSGTIWDMKEIQPKAQSPPTPEKTLAWEPLECFRFHPHEPMIFLEVGITLIPYSLLHPPMDIWHIGRRPFYLLLSGEL